MKQSLPSYPHESSKKYHTTYIGTLDRFFAVCDFSSAAEGFDWLQMDLADFSPVSFSRAMCKTFAAKVSPSALLLTKSNVQYKSHRFIGSYSGITLD